MARSRTKNRKPRVKFAIPAGAAVERASPDQSWPCKKTIAYKVFQRFCLEVKTP